jgi:hypothetical protein
MMHHVTLMDINGDSQHTRRSRAVYARAKSSWGGFSLKRRFIICFVLCFPSLIDVSFHARVIGVPIFEFIPVIRYSESDRGSAETEVAATIRLFRNGRIGQ